MENLIETVRAVRATYGELLTADECVELCNTVAWQHRASGWGVNGKESGNYGVRYDGAKLNVDGLHHQPSNHLVDCLIAAGDRTTGERGPAGPAWQDHGENTQTDRPWVAPIQPQGGIPRTALGVSWFPALGLFRHDRGRYVDAVQWFRDVYRPNYARVIYYLGGEPWRTVGTEHLSDGERRDLFLITLETLLSINVKPQMCVFGTFVPDPSRRRQIFDQFIETFAPFAAQAFLVDGVNEPGPTGFYSDSRSPYAETREVARWLAAAGLPCPISPGSPNSLHQGIDGREASDDEVRADVARLMGDLPPQINASTPHWGRRPWRPHRDLGWSGLIYNDEPRGFKSSVDEIRDPADFRRDYAASKAAGDAGYTLHMEPGVWMGYCFTGNHPDWEDNNEYARFQDIPRIDEIVAALHAERAGDDWTSGTTSPTQHTLLPGRFLEPFGELHSPNGAFILANQGDGNLVLYQRDVGPYWASDTAKDHPQPGNLNMQSDGNLVLYRADGTPVWASGTWGHERAMVQLQDDGNLVIYQDGEPLWASGGPS